MLVLARKKKQAIVISEDITVTVLSVDGGTVRLGIDAPVCIPIKRQEALPVAAGTAGGEENQ